MDSIASTPDIRTTTALLFRVGESTFGCAVAQAQEILPPRTTTRLPGAPPFVRGLINLRGTIVTVLDLGARLDPQRTPSPEAAILLVRHHERLVGVAVDEVTDVRQVPVDDGGSHGDAAAALGSSGKLMRGVAMVDGASVVILDLESLITQVLHS